MLISKEIELDYGHTLPNHFSFCSQIHGHRGRVVAQVMGKIDDTPGSSSQGMVMDFKIVKELMMERIHDALDHGFAVWKDDEVDLEFIRKRNKKFIITEEPPTAEYLAKWAFERIVNLFPQDIVLVRVDWWETPTSCASYSPPKQGCNCNCGS